MVSDNPPHHPDIPDDAGCCNAAVPILLAADCNVEPVDAPRLANAEPGEDDDPRPDNAYELGSDRFIVAAYSDGIPHEPREPPVEPKVAPLVAADVVVGDAPVINADSYPVVAPVAVPAVVPAVFAPATLVEPVVPDPPNNPPPL